MAEVMILNQSEHGKTISALNSAAKKAKGSARQTIQALAEGLGHSPTAGRARRSKETSSMKKTTRKRATASKHNPTPTPRRRVRRNPTTARRSVASKLKSVNVMGLLQRGALIAGGTLAQSFLTRQSERLLPSLPKPVHSALSAAVVAGGSLMLAGGKQWAEDLAIGAIASGLQGMAKEFMPGVFAGDDDLYVQGYEAGAQNYAEALQYADQGQDVNGLEGLSFIGRRIPSDVPTRPSILN